MKTCFDPINLCLIVKVEEIYTAYVMNPTGPSEIMPFNSKNINLHIL